MQTEETHTCVYCGAPATHQFKNGKWCCQEKRYRCSGFKRRLSEKAREVHQRFREQYGDRRSRKGRTLADTNRSSASLVKYPSRGDHVCVYCGGYADFQLKDGRWCCHVTRHSCPEIRKKKEFADTFKKIFNEELVESNTTTKVEAVDNTTNENDIVSG